MKAALEMEDAFLAHLDLIERVARYAGRRVGFPPEEVEDFLSIVKLKLIADDYAVLRKHRGDSSLSTYLTTVVNNLFKDFCVQKFGKYRPSAVAKRLGDAALALERLLLRDKHELEAAIEILKSDPEIDATPQELRQLADRLPRRTPRRFVGEEALERRAAESDEASSDRLIRDGERSTVAAKVETALNLALRAAGAQCLLILKMLFRDGLTVAAIASALHLKQRFLYTHKNKCLGKMYTVFETQGLTWEEVREILGWQGREVRADFEERGGNDEDESV